MIRRLASEFGRAARLFGSTQYLNPRESAFVIKLARAFKDQGRYADAIALLEQVLTFSKTNAKLWIELGKAQRDTGQYDKAVRSFGRAIRLAPENHYARANKGMALERQDKIAEALHCHMSALRAKPDSAMYAMNVGKTMIRLGRERTGYGFLERAKKHIGSESLYNQACLDALLGDPDSAMRKLRQFVKDKPFGRVWAASDPDLINIRDRLDDLATGPAVQTQ